MHAPECTIGAISNFYENSRIFSQVKINHLCHRHRGLTVFIAGVVYTGDNVTGDKHKVANIYANFRKNLVMAPMRYGESRGKVIYEKNLKSKISSQAPFNEIALQIKAKE
jgi:hypothetical protein